MADLPVTPLANYGAMLSSYGDGLANQENARTANLTATAQLPKIQADTSLTTAQAAGANLNNSLLQQKQQALRQFISNMNAPTADNSGTTPSGGGAAGAPASGKTLFDDDGNTVSGGFSTAMDQQMSNKFRVNKAYLPAEQQRLNQAMGLSTLYGDDSFVKLSQTAHDNRVSNDTSTSQNAAQQAADGAYSVATAPAGTAYQALNAIHSDTASLLARHAGLDPDHPEKWSADDKAKIEERVRNYSEAVHAKVFQYTGDKLEDKDGQIRNSRTGLPPLGNQAQGLAPAKWADLATKGSELVDVPQSDGSSIKVPQWRANGARSLDAWVESQANAAASTATTSRGKPSSQGAAPSAVAPGATAPPGVAGLVSDPVLKASLADPTYKLQAPRVVSGQTATPAALDQQKATVAARTALLQDSNDATTAAASSLQYLDAAKAIMASKGAPITGTFGPIANEITRVWGGVNATNYSEVAKYLGNAALANAKGIYGPRMSTSEVGLQLNELSPSTKMTDQAINNLIDSNARSAKYTIDSAQRTRTFLASGGDPQQFASFNEKYFPRAKTVNAGDAGGSKAIANKEATDKGGFVVGKAYKDRSGNVATYQGNGVWK